VVEAHADGDLAGVRIRAVEDRVERDLKILEALDRQVEPHGEADENEVGHAVEVRLAWKRQRYLISHGQPSAPRPGPARAAPRPPSHRRPTPASPAASGATPIRARRRH